ncbi:MAG: hypothetical protein WCS65_17375 [Verrucomicrobiae bacterium]
MSISFGDFHDGAIAKYGDMFVAAAVDPTQIKSATDNNGEFNPEDPNSLTARPNDAEAYDAEIDALMAELENSGLVDFNEIAALQSAALAEEGSPNKKIGRPDLAFGNKNPDVSQKKNIGKHGQISVTSGPVFSSLRRIF